MVEGVNIGWQLLISFPYIYTLFNCIKIVQSCRCVGLLGLDVQSNSFKGLLEILHRLLGNVFSTFSYIISVTF